MPKLQINIDTINTQEDFAGYYQVDLLEYEALDYAFRYSVMVTDHKAHRVEFVRDFGNFRAARAYFLFLQENEGRIVDVETIHILTAEFLSNK